MKKIFLSVLAVFVVTAYASAQDTGFGFGVKAGLNISKLTSETGNMKPGFTGGVFVDYRFTNVFALSADVLYSRQGGKYDKTKEGMSYLNIPVLANFYLVKGLALKAGVQPGFLLSAKLKDGDDKMDFKGDCKSFDLSIPVGLSYDFNCGFILDARYNIGVTDVSKDDDQTYRNSVIAVTAGWRF